MASLGGDGGGADRPGDTLQGVTPEGKKYVGKFTKNSGETRLDRQKRCGVTVRGAGSMGHGGHVPPPHFQ